MEFRDLKKQYNMYKNEIDESISKVLKDAHFISGAEVEDLENKLAEYVGVKYCVTCANGTDALSLVLTAWQIGLGDAVFVPDFTFFASAEVVSQVGATPIFVDVDPRTFNIDVKDLVTKINNVISEGILTPRVIIPVDLFGLSADYETINDIAKNFNLLILEDAAQGFGAEIKGKKAGSFGDAATTSFFPAKPLGCYGDGGAIFTNDAKLYGLLNSYKVHGKGENKYDNIRIGVNSRLDTLQASILLVKLKAFVNHELDDVNRVFEIYNSFLRNYVEIPHIPTGYKSSFAQYTIKLNSKMERDNLKLYLKEHGIPSMIYYAKGMHKQEAFSNLESYNLNFPVSDMLCDTVLSLPMHPYLESDEIKFISEKIIDFLNVLS